MKVRELSRVASHFRSIPNSVSKGTTPLGHNHSKVLGQLFNILLYLKSIPQFLYSCLHLIKATISIDYHTGMFNPFF